MPARPWLTLSEFQELLVSLFGFWRPELPDPLAAGWLFVEQAGDAQADIAHSACFRLVEDDSPQWHGGCRLS